MVMRVLFSFLCEDIFDINDYHGEYDTAGKKLRIFNTVDEDQEIVTTHVLIVTLMNEGRKKPEDALTRNALQTAKKRGVVARDK